MTNSEVKKKMLTKGSVQEICKASGASDEEVKSVLTNALPLLLSASGSSGLGNSGSGLSLLTGLLGGSSQSQSNVAGSLLSTLLGASGTNQDAAEEQLAQETGVGKNKVSLILLAAIPLLLKMLKEDNSSSSSSGSGKKKKPASSSSSGSSNKSDSVADLLLSLLK